MIVALVTFCYFLLCESAVSSPFLREEGESKAAVPVTGNYFFPVKLQSLMIAAIPNIIGWLAISFAKVRLAFLGHNDI